MIDEERARALSEVRQLLEESKYPLIDFRLSLELPSSPTGFPPFDPLREAVERLDPGHRALFRLLRLGEAIEVEELDRLIGDPLGSALRRSGLLLPGEAPGTWRTPSLLLVPAEGLLLLVSTPDSYPTASGPRDTWFDLSATVVARALPGSLSGTRVLDVCSGTGIQALLCGNRGAAQVVGLDVNGCAVAVAQDNAILNRQAALADFRPSDMLATLGAEERFDFFVCNAPYAPVLPAAGPASAPAEIGNGVLWRLLEELPAHLNDGACGVIGLWRSIGYRGSTYQLQEVAARLGEHGYSVSAYVDAAPDTSESVLEILRADLEGGDGDPIGAVGKLFERSDLQMDGFYNQLVFVGCARPRFHEPPLFGIGIRASTAVRLN